MRVNIKITADASKPYAVIYTDKMTPEITELVNEISKYGDGRSAVVGKKEDTLVVLRPEEIYVVRVENEKTYLVGENETYRTGKRLYEMSELLGAGFMQVSRSAIINLKYLESVEPSFNGVMLLHLKNGTSEYISRKYVPELKKYLGL